MRVFDISERLACRLVGLARSSFRRPLNRDTVDDPDKALRAWLRAWARKHARWGYRRAYIDARNDGWVVNHKKIQRLWGEEGLRVVVRRRWKRVGVSDLPTITKAAAPGDVWAIDFQFDSTMAGKPFKILSIVDEHTREALGGKVEYSITAEDLIDQLDVLVIERGMPKALRMDNGPGFISKALREWAIEVDLVFIPPGQPLAQWVHRILQRQAPGRMSQCQPVLLPKPCERHHRNLEGGLQHDPAAFITGVFDPRGLCSTVHPLKPVTTLKVTGPKTRGRSLGMRNILPANPPG
jgi:transposase InsO family protein